MLAFNINITFTFPYIHRRHPHSRMYDLPGQWCGIRGFSAGRLRPSSAGCWKRWISHALRSTYGELHEPRAHRGHVRCGPRATRAEPAHYLFRWVRGRTSLLFALVSIGRRNSWGGGGEPDNHSSRAPLGGDHQLITWSNLWGGGTTSSHNH